VCSCACRVARRKVSRNAYCSTQGSQSRVCAATIETVASNFFKGRGRSSRLNLLALVKPRTETRFLNQPLSRFGSLSSDRLCSGPLRLVLGHYRHSGFAAEPRVTRHFRRLLPTVGDGRAAVHDCQGPPGHLPVFIHPGKAALRPVCGMPFLAPKRRPRSPGSSPYYLAWQRALLPSPTATQARTVAKTTRGGRIRPAQTRDLTGLTGPPLSRNHNSIQHDVDDVVKLICGGFIFPNTVGSLSSHSVNTADFIADLALPARHPELVPSVLSCWTRRPEFSNRGLVAPNKMPSFQSTQVRAPDARRPTVKAFLVVAKFQRTPSVQPGMRHPLVECWSATASPRSRPVAPGPTSARRPRACSRRPCRERSAVCR